LLTFFINEEKIMNKKILLSGIAALLIGGSMHATTVSASALSVSYSGEATLSATFSDICRTAQTDSGGDALADATGAFADFLGISYTPDDDDEDNSGEADSIELGLNAINGFVNTIPEDLSMTGAITFEPNPCGTSNPSADNPVWATSSELSFSAAGTLANGLGVSADLGKGAAGGDGVKVGLSGAFGSINWKNNGDSAVKVAHVGGDGDISVANADNKSFGGHALATAGTAGYVINYAAPSMGGLDLYVSYAPGSAATNTDKYLDTIAIGAAMSAGDLQVSAGWESATANANATASAACDHALINFTDGTTNFDAYSLIDDVYGTDECGDQTLMVLGASMSAGSISISGGYSNLDTEEADRATTSINLGTSAGDWSIGLAYTAATKSSKIAGADTTQTAIGASLGTTLGDGVDFALKVSNNAYDSSAQSTTRGGPGATNDYQAIGELKMTF
jgi:hypothetical protein